VTWTVYAQLADTSPAINADWLMEEVSRHFGPRPGFALKQTTLPFSRSSSVDLASGSWLARLTYEEGEVVVADSIEIQRLTDGDLNGLETSTRRIRVVFSTDEAGEYVNHAIWVTDFLRSIPGVVLFDATRKEYF
jgi:hypothetical protein